MDRRISVLSDCTVQRKQKRFSRKSHGSQVTVNPLPETLEKEIIQIPDAFGIIEDSETNTVSEAGTISPTEFSETPLQDLLALVPQEPGLLLNSSTASFDHSQHTFKDSENSISLQEQFITHSAPRSFRSEHPFTAFIKGSTKVSATDGQSFITEFSTTSLKQRLSHYSSSYIQDIVQLLEAYSISDCSAASTSQTTSPLPIGFDDTSTVCASTLRPSSVTVCSSGSGRGTIMLPSAFLFLDRYVRRQGICLPGLKSHDSGTCWCLEDLDPRSRLWVDRKGPVNQRVDDPPQSLKRIDLQFRDIFGNTVLHMLAARGADIAVIFKALKQGADPNAKNSAGQNFAHLFSRRFLQTLAADRLILMYVLPELAMFDFRFNDCDLFGRSFLHVLTLEGRDVKPNALQGLRWLDRRNRPSRDAFGWVAAIDPTTQAKTTAPFQRTYTLAQLAKYPHLYREFNNDYSPSTSPHNEPENFEIPVSTDPNYSIFKHARLLETAGLAIDVPDIEDTQGRNGLQCLAEVSLTLGDEDEILTASHKRKRDQKDLNSPTTRLTFRYELAQNMIAVGVDVNNYDKDGNTVLMAFVTHLRDGEDDKTLTQLLHCIIHNGANVHWRNRQGETALHIAVSLGRKVATRVLLMNGSNVHARTAEGKGLLAVGEAHYLRARQTPQLYASIMACMALCIQYGAIAQPTLVQEWSVKGTSRA
jgi:ankyrin repeat protein